MISSCVQRRVSIDILLIEYFEHKDPPQPQPLKPNIPKPPRCKKHVRQPSKPELLLFPPKAQTPQSKVPKVKLSDMRYSLKNVNSHQISNRSESPRRVKAPDMVKIQEINRRKDLYQGDKCLTKQQYRTSSQKFIKHKQMY